jgi:uncharacterized protein YaaW (UPF0174 family)
MTNYHYDADLVQVLQNGSKDDIAILIDLMTDNGKGRISLDSDVCKSLTAAKKGSRISNDVQMTIMEELQRFGGNSILNIFRGGKGVPYHEIVCDVADHLKANYKKDQEVSIIESAILMQVIKKSMEKMSEEEKRQFFQKFGVKYDVGLGAAAMASLQIAVAAGGFASYQLSLMAANAVARAVIGRGLALGTNSALTRGISIFAGPIGWALTAIWTAYDLASPAYRVTVPCVVQIAYMRQKEQMQECPKCHSQIVGNLKFCGECGHKLG